MPGCYQCGLPEGTEEKLCETCFRNRFHRGLLVVDNAERVEVGGIGCSLRAQCLVLSGGACICIGLVGIALLLQGHGSYVTDPQIAREYVRYDGGYFPINHQQTVRFIRGPLEDLSEDAVE